LIFLPSSLAVPSMNVVPSGVGARTRTLVSDSVAAGSFATMIQ
jgi:hypothetical protein